MITVSPRKLPARGWQGDSVYAEQPGAWSTAVSPRRIECRRRPITSFTPLRANNKTLTHGLDSRGPPPRTFPAWPRVWTSLMGRRMMGVGSGPWGLPPGPSPRLGSQPTALALSQASHFSLGLSLLICEMGCNAHTGQVRGKACINCRMPRKVSDTPVTLPWIEGEVLTILNWALTKKVSRQDEM